MSTVSTPSKKVKFVRVFCRNPMMPFYFDFASFSDAEGDIEERSRWGELEKITIFYEDGTQDEEEFDAWGS